MHKDHEEALDPAQPGLIVTYGTTQRRFRPLDRDVFLLGRAPGCDLALAAPDIGLVHCVLVRTESGWRLRDCGSRLGSRVNGESVLDGPLDDDDILQVGAFTFQLRLPSVTERSPTRPPAEAISQEEERESKAVDLTARVAEVERQAETLRTASDEMEARWIQLEENENKLAERRTVLERDEEELHRLRTSSEQELARRREETETQILARWEEFRRRCQIAEQAHAERQTLQAAPPVAPTALYDAALLLDRRRAELEHFARHLRRRHEQLNALLDQSAEVARLNAEVERLRRQRAERPAPVVNNPNAGLAEAQARLREETTTAMRKRMEIAASHEEELRRRLAGLEREVQERDILIEKLQAGKEDNPWDTQALRVVEMELNRARMEVDRDRRETNEQLGRLREGREELEQARREAELEMSRERAQVARDRVELHRLREEICREQERLQRDGGTVRERLSAKRFKEEMTDKRRGE